MLIAMQATFLSKKLKIRKIVNKLYFKSSLCNSKFGFLKISAPFNTIFLNTQWNLIVNYINISEEKMNELSSNSEYLKNSFNKLKSDYADIMIEKTSEILLKEDE
jgi:hypothetical protein